MSVKAYNWFVKNLIMRPILPFVGRPVFSHLSNLELSQWWPRKQLLDYQARRLQFLISYSYEHVPYYRLMMDARGLKPSDIQQPADLVKLPILTKELILQNRDALKSDEFSRFSPMLRSTGGSTGDPLKYWLDKNSWSIVTATRYRGWGTAGYQFGDKVISIGGVSINPFERMGRATRGYHQLERNKFISGIDLSEEELQKHTQLLFQFRPQYVYGYASSLYLWAEYLLREKKNVDFVRAVFPTSEFLYPSYRASIESAFACKAFDGYGSRDCGIFGFECDQHQGWHLASELSIAEVVDSETGLWTKDLGDIIVTNLINFSMPFIRFNVRDAGRLTEEACACKRGLPLLAELAGRTGDIFRFNNGKVITGPAFTVLFGKLGFKKYQLRQLDGDTLSVLVVKGPDFIPGEVARATEIIQHHLGTGVSVRLEIVDDIPNLASGKASYFIAQAG
jgi:phenylacetate-CoA ligase